MISSKLASKARTTVPLAMGTALHLRKGDEIAYAIEPGRVILTRARPNAPADDPVHIFSEWDTAADTEAYARL
jgi:antitoxin PrlF